MFYASVTHVVVDEDPRVQVSTHGPNVVRIEFGYDVSFECSRELALTLTKSLTAALYEPNDDAIPF